MRLQKIQTRLLFSFCAILLVSMLLVNFLLLIFWQHDALKRTTQRDKVILARVSDRLATDDLFSPAIAYDFFSFAEFSTEREAGVIRVCHKSAVPVDGAPTGLLERTLDTLLKETITSGLAQVKLSGSFLGLISLQAPILVQTEPVIHEGVVVGSIGIGRSLVPIYSSLRRVEKAVLIYIVINLVVLGSIIFFRMRKLIVRPIQQLVSLADQYHDAQSLLFVPDRPEDEFGMLGNSLNVMLSRVKQDRRSLEKSVSELAEANSKLKTQQQELIRTEKLASVGRMAAGLAHEIGNPVGVVQGYLELLGQSDTQSVENREFIDRAEQELRRVTVLLRQLLDFARVPKGQPARFSVHDLLLSVLDMTKVQPVFKGIHLATSLEAQHDLIDADQDQLRQVIVNCLLNSCDAIKTVGREGGGQITVTTEDFTASKSDVQKQYLLVTITDNGSGIPVEDMENIFDPFFTTKDPGKGTGLGLSVSLSIIESMGGTMKIESDAGKGSKLLLFLPLCPDEYA